MDSSICRRNDETEEIASAKPDILGYGKDKPYARAARVRHRGRHHPRGPAETGTSSTRLPTTSSSASWATSTAGDGGNAAQGLRRWPQGTVQGRRDKFTDCAGEARPLPGGQERREPERDPHDRPGHRARNPDYYAREGDERNLRRRIRSRLFSNLRTKAKAWPTAWAAGWARVGSPWSDRVEMETKSGDHN